MSNAIIFKGEIQTIDEFISMIENSPNFGEIEHSPRTLYQMGKAMLAEIRAYNPELSNEQIEAALDELSFAKFDHTWFVHMIGFAELAMR